MKINRFIFAGIILFTLKVNGQKDSSLFMKSKIRDTLSNSSISINGGVCLIIPNKSYIKVRPGPVYDLSLRIIAFPPNFGMAVKIMYMGYQIFGYSERTGLLTSSSFIQISQMAGPFFIIPLGKFSINVDATLGIAESGYSSIYYVREPGPLYDFGLNLQYALTRKWLLKLNTDYLHCLLTGGECFNITTGVGYSF
jgi:hypothetical protein